MWKLGYGSIFEAVLRVELPNVGAPSTEDTGAQTIPFGPLCVPEHAEHLSNEHAMLCTSRKTSADT